MDTSFDSYSKHLLNFPALGFALDLSRATAPAGFQEKMSAPIAKALADMSALESGAIANPDEKRMVGHYWLRAPELAPQATLTAEIKKAVQSIHLFTKAVHGGSIQGAKGKFTDCL
ncbi:MAG: glucose-6-phosphate isomerase, partial [Opitutae bacterium]|nr:glucose-6-phosphate isomerase [Opitutae bacterium]